MMRGWKTWVAAIGAAATGVSMIAAGVVAEPVNPDMIWQGVMTISGALAIVGIGHKIEKSK